MHKVNMLYDFSAIDYQTTKEKLLTLIGKDETDLSIPEHKMLRAKVRKSKVSCKKANRQLSKQAKDIWV